MHQAVEIAKIIEDAGGKAVAVHGKTREQYYSGKADWDIIRQVKEAVVHSGYTESGDVVSEKVQLRFKKRQAVMRDDRKGSTGKSVDFFRTFGI